MIDHLQDIDEVLEDIDFEKKEEDVFKSHKFSPKEIEAYELGVVMSDKEKRNPYDEDKEKGLFEAFNLGWHSQQEE